MSENFAVFRDIVSESERIELRDYALRLQANGDLNVNPAGPQRYARRIWGGPLVTPLIRELAGRIERRFGLDAIGATVDPELGWVISVILQGGHIQTHVDARLYQDKPVKHLRCNVVISQPESGGNPVISNQLVPLVEGGGWAFFASEYPHSSFPVAGAKPRIVYQFGYSVPVSWTLREAVA